MKCEVAGALCDEALGLLRLCKAYSVCIVPFEPLPSFMANHILLNMTYGRGVGSICSEQKTQYHTVPYLFSV